MTLQPTLGQGIRAGRTPFLVACPFDNQKRSIARTSLQLRCVEPGEHLLADTSTLGGGLSGEVGVGRPTRELDGFTGFLSGLGQSTYVYDSGADIGFRAWINGGFNTYAYVGGNPTGLNDPSGLLAPALAVAAAIGVGAVAGAGGALITGGNPVTAGVIGATTAGGMAVAGLVGLGAAASAYVGGGLNLIGNLVGQFVDGNRSVDGAAAVSATLGGVVGGPFGTILGGASTFTGKLGTEAVGALFSTSTDLSLLRFLKPPELSCPR